MVPLQAFAWAVPPTWSAFPMRTQFSPPGRQLTLSRKAPFAPGGDMVVIGRFRGWGELSKGGLRRLWLPVLGSRQG